LRISGGEQIPHDPGFNFTIIHSTHPTTHYKQPQIKVEDIILFIKMGVRMIFNKYRNFSLSFEPKGLTPPYEAKFWLLTLGGNSTRTENIIKGAKKLKRGYG
jgi:hypothetical protein